MVCSSRRWKYGFAGLSAVFLLSSRFKGSVSNARAKYRLLTGLWHASRTSHSLTPYRHRLCLTLSNQVADSPLEQQIEQLSKVGAVRKLTELCVNAEGRLEHGVQPEAVSRVLQALHRLNAAKHARMVMEALCKEAAGSFELTLDERIVRLVPDYVELMRQASDLEALRQVRNACEEGAFGGLGQRPVLAEHIYLASAQTAIVREQLDEALATIQALHRLRKRYTSGSTEPSDTIATCSPLTDESAKQATDPERVRRFCETMRLFSKARNFRGLFLTMDTLELCGIELGAPVLECLAQSAVRQVSFVTSAVSIDKMPDERFPEAAFIGRSNVGKSSLVNMVIGRKALAKTSKTPGKTKQFNYFLVNERDPSDAFYLVDLPGVGYARVAKEQRLEWDRLFVEYVRRRKKLRVLFHLIDSQTGPLEEDVRLMRLLAELFLGKNGRWNRTGHEDLHYVIALTKIDRRGGSVSPTVFHRLEQILSETGLLEWREIPVLTTSAQTKTGREAVWQYLRLLHKHWN
jgi:GTP-binding protein